MTTPSQRRPLRLTRRRVIGAGAVALLAAVGGVALLEPVDPLAHYNAKLDYRLDDVRAGAAVPRVFTAYIDPPLTDIDDIQARKDVFLRILLPLVLAANEKRPALRRVPVAQALAQAAIESAWGTARFTTEGNAIFGQRTWAEAVPGLKPEDAEGFRVRAFENLMASVEAYFRNLNSHPEYADFRKTRKTLIQTGQPLTARALVPHLTAYSEEGRVYTAKVLTVIAENGLSDFAGARLR